MSARWDAIVIGGGIVGLAHAWVAAQRGLRTLLLERTAVATGASVRNFGMIWPVGQPAGELYQTALRSRNAWLRLKREGVLEVEECGSLHLAHRSDEWAVLEEFCRAGQHDVRLLDRRAVLQSTALANPHGLVGALASPTELRVNPRTACGQIAAWLSDSGRVTCRFSTPVVRVAEQVVHAADGTSWEADRILVCSGSDLATLYPQVLLTAGLRLCKLQMLKVQLSPAVAAPQPHLASGLTLRHYTSFQVCPSLEALRARVATETPELDRFGIHVMASCFPTGDVILGDSHEYGSEISPFDQTAIDDLMLRELRAVFQLPNWTILERWHGIYSKHPELPIVATKAPDGTRICVGTGGAGMTMSFGLAERHWDAWEGAVG